MLKAGDDDDDDDDEENGSRRKCFQDVIIRSPTVLVTASRAVSNACQARVHGAFKDPGMF